MTLLCVATVLAMFALCVIFSNGMYEINQLSTKEMKTIISNRYDDEIKKQVDTAMSMLDHVYSEYEEGETTLEEAKTKGAHILRDMRYGEEGYFWADTYDGENVVLLGGDTEGTNRYEAKDMKGNFYIKDIINNGKQSEGGYTDYYF